MKAALQQRKAYRRTSLVRRSSQAKGKSSLFLNDQSCDRSDKPVQDLCRKYDISRETLSRLTGFSLRTLANWSEGKRPTTSSTKKLGEIARLFDALNQQVKAEAIGPWLRRPNPAFQGSTPLQVIERGEIDRIWRLIWELETGNTG